MRASDAIAASILVGFGAFTAFALWLSAQRSVALWLSGQVLLGIAFLQWFVVLHEAGHGVFFRSRRRNALAGHLASFFAAIPFSQWTWIHRQHHVWTGWQDKDPTTAALVPRPLQPLERALLNFCWRFWVPIFSVVYRVNNFWNLPRLRRLVPTGKLQRRVTANAVALCAIYLLLAAWMGPLALVRLVGLGFLLSLVIAEPIMLSQHTHIPMRIAGTAAVTPIPLAEQEPYTRSLRFPRWFATAVLLNFDAHELHHLHPSVPGYRLRSLDRRTLNEAHWWQWIKKARALPAEVFLFQNRTTSGFDV